MSWGKTYSDSELNELLWTAFVHRDDVYALQRETGAYYPVHEDLDAQVIRRHLRGDFTVGTYQLDTDNTVSWVCFDLDHESLESRQCLVQCVQHLLAGLNPGDYVENCRALLLEDSNGLGRTHVWLLLSSDLPAQQVRAWLAHDFWPMWEEWTAGNAGGFTDKLEVFPKQDELEPGGYGNLVRLPLGVNRKNGLWSEILHHSGWGSLDSYWRLDSSLVPVYESPRLLPASGDSRVRGDNATARLLRGEVYEGERNNTFASAAWHLRQEGIDQDLALEQLTRWNSHLPDPLDESEIFACVRGAYRKQSAVEPNEHRRPDSGRKRERWTPR